MEQKVNISLSLIESTPTIRRAILQEISKIMTKAIDKATPRISKDIKQLLKEALKQEPEYQSLMSGTLKAEFGIPSSSQVDAVIEAIAETVQIKRTQIATNNFGVTGGFSLTAMKTDDIGGVINTAQAQVNDAERGYVLPWLEWLLLKNNQILVRNYEVQLTSNPRSRSGMALMVSSNKNWRVPPEFAGSASNNWTTRAASRIESSVYNIIRKHIEAAIP